MGYVTTRELKSWLSELGKGSYADYVRKVAAAHDAGRLA